MRCCPPSYVDVCQLNNNNNIGNNNNNINNNNNNNNNAAAYLHWSICKDHDIEITMVADIGTTHK